MNGISFLMMPLVLMAAAPAGAAGAFETDVLPTAAGDLKITFIGHASLMFEFGGKVIYNDPVGQYGDFSGLPKADLILVAHEHGDHFDLETIKKISKSGTKVVLTPLCAAKLAGGIVLKNGEETTVDGIRIEAVPAYNLVHMRSPGGALSSEGGRERLHSHLRRQTGLYRRGHGEHPGDEEPQAGSTSPSCR